MYKKEIKLAIIVWGVFLIGILVLGTYFTINRVKNDTSYTKAQIENIGKPVEINQHYYSPNSK